MSAKIVLELFKASKMLFKAIVNCMAWRFKLGMSSVIMIAESIGKKENIAATIPKNIGPNRRLENPVVVGGGWRQ